MDLDRVLVLVPQTFCNFEFGHCHMNQHIFIVVFKAIGGLSYVIFRQYKYIFLYDELGGLMTYFNNNNKIFLCNFMSEHEKNNMRI